MSDLSSESHKLLKTTRKMINNRVKRTVRSILAPQGRIWPSAGRIGTMRQLETGVGPVQGQTASDPCGARGHRSTSAAAAAHAWTAAVYRQTCDHLLVILLQKTIKHAISTVE